MVHSSIQTCLKKFGLHLKRRVSLTTKKKVLEMAQDIPENTHFLLHILVNYVGQNKSGDVFMFYPMLSIMFYKKVVLLYLFPGLSPNAVDRVVAWCRGKIKAFDLYSHEQIVSKMNKTESVHVTFLDHRKNDYSFAVGMFCRPRTSNKPHPATRTTISLKLTTEWSR